MSTNNTPQIHLYCISINKFFKNFEKSAQNYEISTKCSKIVRGAFGAVKKPFFQFLPPWTNLTGASGNNMWAIVLILTTPHNLVVGVQDYGQEAPKFFAEGTVLENFWRFFRKNVA